MPIVENVEQLELSDNSWYKHFRKLATPTKAEHMHTLWPSDFTSRNLPNTNAYICSLKLDIFENVHSNIFYYL